MRRALLVISVLVSLWPVAVIASAAIGGSGHQGGGSNSATSSTGGTTTTNGALPDYASLRALQAREVKLLQQLRRSDSLHGRPDHSLVEGARRLGADYAAWESTNRGLDIRADRVESLEAQVADRVANFAANPSQARLDAFNQAVAAYNASLPSG